MATARPHQRIGDAAWAKMNKVVSKIKKHTKYKKTVTLNSLFPAITNK
jgi:hypothetical protein